ncbi:fungal-specific transcription factor domain-containing protein [Cyathus striatus]|nr:fungal-specific transcription factor domain-containing protein [Cyathus striatus]
MTSPPAEPESPGPNPSQPLPHQPHSPTPPTTSKPSPATRKPRQRKQADSKQKPSKSHPERPSQPSAHSAPPSSGVVPGPVVYAPPRPGPIFQPYAASPYHIMNPSYPMNGSPYSQQHQQQSPYGAQPPPMHPGGPAMPHHPPPYGYAVPHPYQAHPYHGYPQYAPQMVPVYAHGTPRQSAPPDTPQSAPSPVLPGAGGKRKRKSLDNRGKGGVSDDENGASGSDMGRGSSSQQQAMTPSLVDLKKRTKTQRACDSCRSRKIRCDIIPESEPPICRHCQQYAFECTFFLPITETRFKKKKLEEEAAAAAEREKADSVKAVSSPTGGSQDRREIGIFGSYNALGPTSPAHLLHSQASISSRIYENYDLRYNHSFEVSKSGDGLIQVQKPAHEEQQLVHPKMVDVQIERDVIEKLINAYFTDVAPILPVVTQAEFLETQNPAPVLLYSMCLVAAGRREVPQKIFDSIRYTVNAVIKAEDVLSTATITNVQALLILCMMGDSHSQFVPNALSALWIRLGTAIRMAQDLGLHRTESVKHNVELRRRLWAACLISDRWASLAYGHPYMIDIQDCDVRLPSNGDPSGLYMDELVRVSILLGRVLKAIYSPAGLNCTTDETLSGILNDMEDWKAKLPDHLQFRGPETPRNAGLLHLLYACVCMMFWRVFMRISYSCPAHLKFGLTVGQWTKLVELTGEAIDWLDQHEEVYDVWLIVAYAATSCALVQYHTWARRKDQDAASKLRKLRDCVSRWEAAISPDHMSARRKAGLIYYLEMGKIITLLYEATQGEQPPVMETPALNPTGGVTGKPPIGLDYKKDPTRPGGGVFVARGKTSEDLKDIPAGIVISGTSDEDSEGEGTSPMAATSTLLEPTNSNDHDRTLFSPSAFAPPLPGDRSFSRSNPISPAYSAGGLMIPVSAMRSPVAVGEQQQQQQVSAQTQGVSPTGNGSSLVNFTPLNPKGYPNVNPAMNQAQDPNVQVMNVLDVPQSGDTLAEFSVADNSFLEGIPPGMFDFGGWDNFFSRFSGSTPQPQGEGNAALSAAAMQQHQQAQQQRLQQQQQQQQQQVQSSPIMQTNIPQQNLPPRFSS